MISFTESKTGNLEHLLCIDPNDPALQSGFSTATSPAFDTVFLAAEKYEKAVTAVLKETTAETAFYIAYINTAVSTSKVHKFYKFNFPDNATLDVLATTERYIAPCLTCCGPTDTCAKTYEE